MGNPVVLGEGSDFSTKGLVLFVPKADWNRCLEENNNSVPHCQNRYVDGDALLALQPVVASERNLRSKFLDATLMARGEKPLVSTDSHGIEVTLKGPYSALWDSCMTTAQESKLAERCEKRLLRHSFGFSDDCTTNARPQCAALFRATLLRPN